MSEFDEWTGGRAHWRGRNVLLTGHTGFKGAWLSAWLTELGARVHGFSLPQHAVGARPSLAWSAWSEQPTELVDHRGDIEDGHAMAELVERVRPQVVFHLAAQALVLESYADPLRTWRTNVLGTLNLLEALRLARQPCAVVVVTTDKCYENREWQWPYRESDTLGGHDPYSASKAACELAVASWRRSYAAELGIKIATARAGNVIGGGDDAPHRIVPDTLRSLEAGKPLRLRNPNSVRPYQHVLEPLAGYLRLAALLDRGHDALQTAFNFGPDPNQHSTTLQLVESLDRAWGGDSRLQVELGPPAQAHEAGRLTLDTSKAAAELGWRPRLALATALQWVVEWQRAYRAGAARAVMIEQIGRYRQLTADAASASPTES